jgi:hypothetical protein
MVEGLKILLLSIGAAVTYGILHDQITARVCVEYFTFGHPPIFETDSPTLLGLGWGIIATWWAGLFVGVVALFAARVGVWPKMSARNLFVPVVYLLLAMGLLAAIAGISGYVAAQAGAIVLVEPLASQIPRERHSLFLADGAAHLASYAAGFIGGLILSVWIFIRRRSMARMN